MHSAVAAEASAPLAATEQATLQLLFDTMVLSTTLAPPPAAGAAPSAAQAAAAKLEAALAAELDPIDRAAFEPHLRRLASQCVQQRAVALGLLMPAPPVLKVRGGVTLFCGGVLHRRCLTDWSGHACVLRLFVHEQRRCDCARALSAPVLISCGVVH